MSDEISDQTTVTISSKVISSRTGAETILMNVESTQYFALEGAAGRIWAELSAPSRNPIGQVIESLQAEFDVDPAVLRDDVHEMVRQLRAKGLLIVD